MGNELVPSSQHQKTITDLGWESLENRRNKHELIIFFKVINGLASNNHLDLVPPIIQETTHYNLQNADDIQTLYARTSMYYTFFFPSTIRV